MLTVASAIQHEPQLIGQHEHSFTVPFEPDGKFAKSLRKAQVAITQGDHQKAQKHEGDMRARWHRTGIVEKVRGKIQSLGGGNHPSILHTAFEWLQNGIEHGEGIVHVNATLGSDGVVISISDSGNGLLDEQIQSMQQGRCLPYAAEGYDMNRGYGSVSIQNADDMDVVISKNESGFTIMFVTTRDHIQRTLAHI